MLAQLLYLKVGFFNLPQLIRWFGVIGLYHSWKRASQVNDILLYRICNWLVLTCLTDWFISRAVEMIFLKYYFHCFFWKWKSEIVFFCFQNILFKTVFTLAFYFYKKPAEENLLHCCWLFLRTKLFLFACWDGFWWSSLGSVLVNLW